MQYHTMLCRDHAAFPDVCAIPTIMCNAIPCQTLQINTIDYHAIPYNTI